MTGHAVIGQQHMPPLPADLSIPADTDGPVFAEPWEARVFALVVKLQQAGLFAWGDFQAVLVDEITHSEAAGSPRPYYLNWAMAAERLFEQLGLAERVAVDTRVADLRPDDHTVRLR